MKINHWVINRSMLTSKTLTYSNKKTKQKEIKNFVGTVCISLAPRKCCIIIERLA